MSIRRYYTVGDFVNEMFGSFDGFAWHDPTKTNFSLRGSLIDTEKYDIVLKKEYLDKEIARKEEELKHLQEVNKQHEERIREEISILKDQRDKKRK